VITNTPVRKPKCIGCGAPATRRARCDGRLSWLCPKCPSDSQLRQRTAAVRRHWRDIDYYRRMYDCRTDSVGSLLAVYFDAPERVVSTLPIRDGLDD
jgi:hypothetical protein